MFLFHKETQREIEISSKQLAQHGREIGKSGIYADYEFNHDPRTGSFRNFRDHDLDGQRQIFVEDLAAVLGRPEADWKGPSWSCFYHAVFNGRPMALITARGHRPATIREGIRLWVEEGHLPCEPNYLAIYQ